jgi:hypothetical protein
MRHYLWMLVVGINVAAIARLFMPGVRVALAIASLDLR